MQIIVFLLFCLIVREINLFFQSLSWPAGGARNLSQVVYDHKPFELASCFFKKVHSKLDSFVVYWLHLFFFLRFSSFFYLDFYRKRKKKVFHKWVYMVTVFFTLSSQPILHEFHHSTDGRPLTLRLCGNLTKLIGFMIYEHWQAVHLQGPEFEAKVTRLVELGFGREAVIQALNFFDGNEDQAAGYLFGGWRWIYLSFVGPKLISTA